MRSVRVHYVLLAACAAACSSPGDRPEGEEATTLGSVAQPIINGYTLPAGQQLENAINVSEIYSGTGCSGVAIDKQWVMTAGHCTYWMNYTVVDQVSRASDTSEVRNVSEVRHHPNANVGEHDLALIRVARPFSSVPGLQE